MTDTIESKEVETPTFYQRWFGRSKITEFEVVMFGESIISCLYIQFIIGSLRFCSCSWKQKLRMELRSFLRLFVGCYQYSFRWNSLLLPLPMYG